MKLNFMHGRRWMEKRKKEIEKRGRREIIWLRKKRDKEMLKMRERERQTERQRERPPRENLKSLMLT